MPPSHQDVIRDQFTQQAVPFSTAQTIANDEALQLLDRLGISIFQLR